MIRYNLTEYLSVRGPFSVRILIACYFQSGICFNPDHVLKAYNSLEIGFVTIQSSISHPDIESDVDLSNFVQFLDGFTVSL